MGRYNELVREMSKGSQFILITHNKHTMEVADMLYGVTMEEPGVSKLVSVNLKQLPRRHPHRDRPRRHARRGRGWLAFRRRNSRDQLRQSPWGRRRWEGNNVSRKVR